MPATQAKRSLAIKSPLGDDTLLIRGASISEHLGRMFQINADLICDDPNLDFSGIVGEKVTIRADLPNKKTRFFNGYVSRFVQTDADQTGGTFHATIVPWLWFLTRTSDCRIFQNMTVPDIIKKVFSDAGFSDIKDSLTATYTPWENCVQYRETDFNFVSRLMEHEGIYYFFEHEEEKHTLVLADSISAHQDYDGYEEVPFYSGRTGVRNEEHINGWVLEQEVQPGSYALNDFNFETPKTSLVAQSNLAASHSQANWPMYDYPGEYGKQSDGTDYAKLRIEELHAQQETVQGRGNAKGLAVGYTFTLTHALRRDQNRKYLITSANYQFTNDEFQSGGAGDGEFYSLNFAAIDSTKPFRATRVTPKPLIQGPQTAIVVGPKGEEIYTDQYGRIKVQFHWDRYSKADENSSCWLRISQAAWAGKKWGALYIPRIGQEVIVEFLEGDPDLPIVTGRVYNADAMPPYPLPDEKTKTTLKSYSSKGGGGFNEMRFEDKKGEEQLFFHAEKNLDVWVKNDRMETVENDRHLHVKNDKFEKTDANRNEEVGVSHFEKIGTDRNVTVGGKEAIDVTGNSSLKVGGKLIHEVGGDLSQKVTGAINSSGGTDINLQGGTSISLSVNGKGILINSSGVYVTGPVIEVKSDGPLTLQGGGPTILKGAVVNINC